MTFQELALRENLSGNKIEAVIDGCGESAEIGLYRISANDENEPLEWPDDWGSWVSVQSIRDLGIEVIVA